MLSLLIISPALILQARSSCLFLVGSARLVSATVLDGAPAPPIKRHVGLLGQVSGPPFGLSDMSALTIQADNGNDLFVVHTHMIARHLYCNQ